MLNQELEISLNIAFARAREYKHEYLTVEHLLLALLNNPSAQTVLEGLQVDVETFRQELNVYIAQNVPIVASEQEEITIEPTVAFQRVIQRAVFQVQAAGKQEVSGAHVLVAMFNEPDSYSVFLLKKHHIEQLDITNYLSHHMSPKEENSSAAPYFQENEFTREELTGQNETQAQNDQFVINLNEVAKNGQIDPLIGRNNELERTIQILCRRRKNNPILVGEAGVGKTAIAEGLAWRIVQKEVPEIIADSTIYSLDIGALIAGTKYRGEFEKRFKTLLSHLETTPNSILFIDEIHVIIGAGATSGGQIDVANLIKPLLSSGRLRVIGATTYKEFGHVFEKDVALARRFQKVDIVEPSIEETVKILTGLKSSYEAHHDVHYTPKALRAAVELSAKYIHDRHLPDKAIDVMDEAGAAYRLLPNRKRRKTIQVGDIETVIAKMARIPQKKVTNDDRVLLKSLAERLNQSIFGQSNAINALSEAIKMNRAGLSHEKRPVGSFLFAGPTGVGKTEVTQQLARELNVEILRFDMSEYREQHTISRLIGSPPGYIGYEQGGLLTDAVLKHPYSVVLLDEIEKAHPDVFNLLLQVMDNGTLTDSTGRKVDFRNTILIMTTNAGAQEMQRNSIGFQTQENRSDLLEELKKIFTPEFRNRLDEIIWFEQLSPEVIAQIVDKFIQTLQEQLNDKQVVLNVLPEARSWLARKGYDKRMGARPMMRTIQTYLKKPLADELLFGTLVKGGTVDVLYDKVLEKLIYQYHSLR